MTFVAICSSFASIEEDTMKNQETTVTTAEARAIASKSRCFEADHLE
jgi:hypothetical protein